MDHLQCEDAEKSILLAGCTDAARTTHIDPLVSRSGRLHYHRAVELLGERKSPICVLSVGWEGTFMALPERVPLGLSPELTLSLWE